MQHWWVDPMFDPLQELHDLKQEHEKLADCHNQLVSMVEELMRQNKVLLQGLRAQRLPRPTKQTIEPQSQ